MDANGARELSKRLEAQAHWRQAPAVQRGEQPAADPDAPSLQECSDGVRRYCPDPDSGTALYKRLVDGRWEASYEAIET
jgi:hypothetical protein